MSHSLLEWFFSLLLGPPGWIAAFLATYLLVVSIAALFFRPARWSTRTIARLDVLVPAHDEAALIGRCIDSLLSQTYSRCLYRVIVVADNCTDRTADLALSRGVDVMQRFDPRLAGKGHALRWAMDTIQSDPAPPDAFVVVDADSVADRHLLAELAGAFSAGHEVVQAEYLALAHPGTRSELGAVGFLLFHRVRFAGRAVLGMPANLVGNGMLLSRRIVERHPWDAFSAVEDLEYSVRLRLAGVRPFFAGAARIAAPVASRGNEARRQRRRWEGGRFFVIRHWLPKLLWSGLARRNWQVLDEAIDLAVPPLGLLALASLAGAGLCLGLILVGALPLWLGGPWFFAACVIPLHVLIGLRAAGAPRSAYGALLLAPYFVLRKVAVYSTLLRSFDIDRWEPAERSLTEPR